ncbi:hypothetical protein, partial [Malikia spinosa]|uniref:hypothetical protein n=1 Tax=Malikia spinosa TaxID=86180 RepID=UPI003FA1FAC7
LSCFPAFLLSCFPAFLLSSFPAFSLPTFPMKPQLSSRTPSVRADANPILLPVDRRAALELPA